MSAAQRTLKFVGSCAGTSAFVGAIFGGAILGPYGAVAGLMYGGILGVGISPFVIALYWRKQVSVAVLALFFFGPVFTFVSMSLARSYPDFTGVFMIAGGLCFLLFLFWMRLKAPNVWPIRKPYECASCGYDLRGTPDGHCPECGIAFKRKKHAESSAS